MATFHKIFNGLLFEWALWMYWTNLNNVALPVPEIIGGRLGGQEWYCPKEGWWVPIDPPQELFLYLYASQRYCHVCALAHHFTPAQVPKFPHVSLGLGVPGTWMVFGWATKSEGVRALSVQNLHRMWSWFTNVTEYRRTDCVQLLLQDRALRYSASRGKNGKTPDFYLLMVVYARKLQIAFNFGEKWRRLRVKRLWKCV